MRATSVPPATASEPPSQKSFWTSTTMTAVLIAPIVLVLADRDDARRDGWFAAGELQAVPGQRHHCLAQVLAGRVQIGQIRNRPGVAPATTTSSTAVPVALCTR